MRSALLFAVFAFGLGCGQTTAPGAASTQAAAGLRIVSVAPSTTEILFALGVGPQVVGVTRFCDYPPVAKDLPKVGGFTDLSLEAIVALRPDLVVGGRIGNIRPMVEKLESLGIKTAFPADTSLPEVYGALRELGVAVGRPQAGAKMAETLQTRLEQIKTATSALAAPRVLLVVGWKPIIVAAKGTFLDTLLQYAGGVNVAQDSTSPYPAYDLEAIIRRAPDVIIDASMEDPNADVLARWSLFTDLPAVQNKRVYPSPNASLLRPGPRLAEGLTALAKLIHPELTLP